MSTSLSQQLQRLAVPQTAVLSDSKYKASILFDSKEAATKDRRTIFELSYSGLQELIALNASFQQFEATLFDETTMYMERAVEQKEVNELLDKNISKFLHHLSPYFLLRPAHMCIEWLLRRFHVHDYNRDALMALALPYHETKTFVRVIQAIRLKETDKDWSWLRPMQRAGVPVPKGALITRAASHPAFLTFVCNSMMEAMRELGQRGHLLQAQKNFYTSIVVGALENASPVREWHISTILRPLFKSLDSDVVDFVSSGYTIAAQLVARVQVTAKLCNALLGRVAACPYDRLRHTAVLLLIWIFDTQEGAKPQFTEESLLNLVKQKWLTGILAKLATDKVAIHPLVVSLIHDAVQAIQSQKPDAEIFKAFLDRLLNNVHFPDPTAQRVISCFLDSYVAPVANAKAVNSFEDHEEGDVIELDSDDDDDMTGNNSDFESWYSEFLRKLEHQYPNAFDMTIKEALKSGSDESSNRNKALKMALGYRLKSFDQSATNIYESLYHPMGKIRLFAVQSLLDKLGNYKSRPQNYQLLKECLADRIVDDSELVVGAILKLATKDFVEILGCEKFVEALFNILYKTQAEPERWSELILPVVQHLTTEQVVESYDTNLILLALMPLLFPNENNHIVIEALAAVTKSPLAEKVTFLKSLSHKGSLFDAGEFRKRFLDVLASNKTTPTVLELMQSVQRSDESHQFLTHSMQFTHFLVLLTGCLKQNLSSAECSQLFDQVHDYSKRFPIKYTESGDWRKMAIKDFVPLELFSDFLVMLTRHLNGPEDKKEGHKCFTRVFNLVTGQSFTQVHPKSKEIWTKTLKETFDIVLPTPQEKIEFLTKFYIHSAMPEVGEQYPALRLRSFKLMNVLLKNKLNDLSLGIVHVLKICVALTADSAVIRTAALETLKQMLSLQGLDETLKQFIGQIVERNCEIGMDQEQFPLILYTILKPDGEKKKQLLARKILNDILGHLRDNRQAENLDFTTKVLAMLKHINDEHILGDLLPWGIESLKAISRDGSMKLLNEPYSTVYRFVIDRFDQQTVENVLLDRPEAWQFLELIFKSYDVFLAIEGKLQPVPCVALDALDEYTYEKMPGKYKVEFVRLIVKTCAVAENDTVFLAANKLLKKCSFDCQPLVPLIEQMYKIPSKSNTPQRKSQLNKLENFDYQGHISTLTWKEGVVLLELLENKKRVTGAEKIIPALFDLLKFCLQVEEQTLVEYAKQLTLSALLHCCKKAEESGVVLQEKLPKSSFRIDQVVQCVRASPNPQTHHNALLLLSHCASLFPQQVLHNIVDIFTFMGSSVVRQDDAFSFHIIDKIIESIIPIVTRNNSPVQAVNEYELNKLVVPVLKIFSDIMLDVPEHRRLPLYTKLLQTLGSKQYLWAFLCVVLEAHVLEDEKQRLLQKKTPNDTAAARGKHGKRMDMVLELTNAFYPTIVLETCIQLMSYISNLPISSEKEAGPKRLKSSETTEVTLFDVKSRSDKQLRHYRYVILQFLSSITSSPQFLRQIAQLNDLEQEQIRPCHQNFIIKILSYVPKVNSAIEQSDERLLAKYWKVHLHHLHDILDNAISLLSPDMFLVVVNGLLQHKLMSVRKKVVELLISKLQQKEEAYFETCDEENFHNLLQPLSGIVSSILKKDDDRLTGVPSPNSSGNELAHLQQVSLIAVKLLSKMFALRHIAEFKALLGELTQIVKKFSSVSKIVLATVILTMIEVSSNLKAHSLSQLPKFMPKLIEVLQEQADQLRHHPPDNVCIAIITGMQKLFEALPLFLGPYLVDIITLLATMHARLLAQQKDQQTADQKSLSVAMAKLSVIWTRIGTEVPARSLIPNCEEAYRKLMDGGHCAEIGALMQLLQQSIKHNTNDNLANVQYELNNFFLNAIQFRLVMGATGADPETVSVTEASIISAFVAYILKLSETSFRPLFQKLCQWALKEHASEKAAILSFFLLCNKIAEELKLLFVLFAGDFIDDAAEHLVSSNTAKEIIGLTDEPVHIGLLKAILGTLYHIFLHDSRGFVNGQRFKVLLQPIVDQLENRLVLENEDLQKSVSSCIAQLAVTVSEDIHWKELNYQVLLKTRTNVPEVRILAFNTCVDIARKLDEDFTPLLPETVPFIAELFEDENPRVEKNTRKSVQELEVILGESLQKYL